MQKGIQGRVRECIRESWRGGRVWGEGECDGKCPDEEGGRRESRRVKMVV